MEISIELIKAGLRKPGKTKGHLAVAMGVRAGAVSEILGGKREIKAKELPAIVDYLELQDVPVMGNIGAGAVIQPDFEQVPPEGLSVVRSPFPIPDEMIGFQVQGDSMIPRYDEGDVIVVWKEQKQPIESFYGYEAAVRTVDGRRFLKTIQKGKGNSVTLTSFNSTKPIENVRLAWIGEIYVVVRRSQVRKITQRQVAAE